MDDKMWIKRMPDDYYNHPSFCSDIFLTQKTGDICEGWHKNRMNISEKDSLFFVSLYESVSSGNVRMFI